MPKAKKKAGIRLSDDKINKILEEIDAGRLSLEAASKKNGTKVETIEKWQKRRAVEGVYVSRKPGRQAGRGPRRARRPQRPVAVEYDDLDEDDERSELDVAKNIIEHLRDENTKLKAAIRVFLDLDA